MTEALNSSVQIKVTLPLQLQQYAQGKANRFGLSLATYIRHLVFDDVKDIDMPTFQMSKENEKVVLEALKDEKQGKTHSIDSIDDFTNAL